ncbi:hypothetical protein D3C80_601830 [compost metagenome]
MPIQHHLPLGRAQSDQPFHQLRPPSADQPGETEDLAFTKRETGIARKTRNVEPFDLEHGLTHLCRMPVWIKLRNIAPHHQPCHVRRLKLRGIM